MKDTVFIVCDDGGVVRMTKRPPSLYRHEVAVKLVVAIPDNCFRSWVFGAQIDVPEDRVIQPDINVSAVEIEQEPEPGA